MSPKRIVITGGPGTGKTSIIKHLELQGYYCFPEIIRSMTLDAKKAENDEEFISNPLAFVADPFLFNQKLLRGRVLHFHQATSMEHPFVFYDRGIPDVLAYMNYFKQEFDEEFKTACSNHHYDKVFILHPWKEIYISDNERLESFKEAKEVHDHLDAVYKEFGYHPLTVPEGTVEERTSYILSALISNQ